MIVLLQFFRRDGQGVMPVGAKTIRIRVLPKVQVLVLVSNNLVPNLCLFARQFGDRASPDVEVLHGRHRDLEPYHPPD